MNPIKTNMTPADIMSGLKKKNRMLTDKNDEYVQLVEKRAQAEYNYNVLVAEHTLKLKAQEYSITLIDKLVKGNPAVAKTKFDYDIAVGIEKACLESIKNIRSAIDTYRSLLTWLRAELTNQS